MFALQATIILQWGMDMPLKYYCANYYVYKGLNIEATCIASRTYRMINIILEANQQKNVTGCSNLAPTVIMK